MRSSSFFASESSDRPWNVKHLLQQEFYRNLLIELQMTRGDNSAHSPNAEQMFDPVLPADNVAHVYPWDDAHRGHDGASKTGFTLRGTEILAEDTPSGLASHGHITVDNS